MHTAIPLSVSDRFVMALEGLYRAVAARFRSGVISVAMIHLVCRRIRHAEQRVLHLLARYRAGWRPVARTGGGGAVERAAPRAAARLRVPRRFGWLLALVPYEAAGYASQLRHTLADPEMQAMLAAVPQARRTLAPVCRMLAIEPEVLSPPGAVASDGDIAEVVGHSERGCSEATMVEFQAELHPTGGERGRGPPF